MPWERGAPMLRAEDAARPPWSAQDAQDAQDDSLLTQRHLAQRLTSIEMTVEMIQSALLEAAETGETRHEHLLLHLQELKDDVVRNHTLLKELRRRGCVRKECVFLVVVVGVVAWVYMLHRWL